MMINVDYFGVIQDPLAQFGETLDDSYPVQKLELVE